MKKVLYFAYGSNMMFERLERRLSWMDPVIKTGTHKLYGWKLCFNAESNIGINNFANIIKGEATDFVEGVLYQITHRQFKHLDHIEGLYEREFFDIDANTLGCAYVCVDTELIGQKYTPEEEYINICLLGAVENNLEATIKYLWYLKQNINFNRSRREKSFKNY